MRIFVLFLLAAMLPAQHALAQTPGKTGTAAPAGGKSSDSMNIPFSDQLKNGAGKGPTYINSDSLMLRAKDRAFEYKGSVKVTHGDMTLTSDVLEGFYDEQNQIQRLVARSNVVITKSDMKGSSQRATYEKKTETVTLTENPQLEQNGSILSADLIRIFLNEDRSVAEGTVRVTLAEQVDKKPTPTAAPSPSPTVSTPKTKAK